LADECSACAHVGIEFLSSPTKDFGLPEVLVFDALVQKIAGMLEDGRHVAVHCRAGIGRSGMVTAATLMALGLDVGTAISQVAQARGVPIPDTVEQGKFIADCEKRRIPITT
jgi:protein-tyrosine phosphatase